MWTYGSVTALYCHAHGAGKNLISPVLSYNTVTNNGRPLYEVLRHNILYIFSAVDSVTSTAQGHLKAISPHNNTITVAHDASLRFAPSVQNR